MGKKDRTRIDKIKDFFNSLQGCINCELKLVGKGFQAVVSNDSILYKNNKEELVYIKNN